MQFRFSGQAELIQSTGDFEIHALVGDMPIRCLVERGAITAGFTGAHISEEQILQLFAARKPEIESIASQRFFNGERSPVVKRQHMIH